MTLLADNDVVLSLAAFDLLGETCEWLGIEVAEVQALESAQFRFRRPGRLVDQYSEAGVNRALAFVQQAGVVGVPEDRSELDALQRAAAEGYAIDPGEAVLFTATAIQPPDFLLTTGDKRCLTDLAQVPEVDALRSRLNRRVLCLEYVLLELLDVFGFAAIQAKVWERRACDGAVRQAFGWSGPAGESSVREGLQSFVRDLDGRTAGMLVVP